MIGFSVTCLSFFEQPNLYFWLCILTAGFSKSSTFDIKSEQVIASCIVTFKLFVTSLASKFVHLKLQNSFNFCEAIANVQSLLIPPFVRRNYFDNLRKRQLLKTDKLPKNHTKVVSKC
jgi:hypothetical protein